MRQIEHFEIMVQKEISVIQTFEYKDKQPASEYYYIQIGDSGTEAISRDELRELGELIQKTLANMHDDARKVAREELRRQQGQHTDRGGEE